MASEEKIAGNYVIEVLIFPGNDALDECRINFLSNLEVWSILMDFSMIDSPLVIEVSKLDFVRSQKGYLSCGIAGQYRS